MTRRIALIGGGYATLHAYRTLTRRLRRQIRRGDVELVVVSADSAHSFHGFTGEVLAGLLPFGVTRTDLSAIMPRASFVHAEVTHVDTRARLVSYRRVDSRACGQVRYDELVVGVGAREPVGRVPGLARHGHPLRAVGGIAGLADRLGSTAASSARQSVPASARAAVVVAGGGLAGVELAAAIADRGNDTVVLVHSGAELVPALRADFPRLARYTEAELARLGVDVRLNTQVTGAEGDRVSLSDGTEMATSVVLTAIGQRAVILPGLQQLPRDPDGRLLTRPDLSVAPGIWAAGDVASIRHPVSGEPVPANALWAIKGGAHVGRNLARRMRGRRTKAFRYRGLGQAASFGVGRSAAELYGVSFTGWAAWGLRLAFFLRFMPSRRNAASVVGHTVRLVATGQRPASAGRPLPSSSVAA